MSEPQELYYVVLRGAGRQPIFNSDDDRGHFTKVIADQSAASGVTVYAYCWLKAEARLAVQLSSVSITHFAQRVARQHAQRLEREISLTGSHFEQKCRGVKVDGQTALVDLVRHIHLAPLKAGLTADPSAYPWSSHRVYLGLAQAPWLDTGPLLNHFRQSEGDAQRGYMKFMGQGVANVGAIASLVEPAGVLSTPRNTPSPRKK
jgi:REP element-mobilizing transposase RayT